MPPYSVQVQKTSLKEYMQKLVLRVEYVGLC